MNTETKWNTLDIKPPHSSGWYAVAVLPRNHSGLCASESCDLKGDNEWRKKFGFAKAWLNNGNWWVADPHGMKCTEVTELVTHWAELPQVPELKISYSYPGNHKSWMWGTKNEEQIIQMALESWAEESKKLFRYPNHIDFVEGFKSAMNLMFGIK